MVTLLCLTAAGFHPAAIIAGSLGQRARRALTFCLPKPRALAVERRCDEAIGVGDGRLHNLEPISIDVKSPVPVPYLATTAGKSKSKSV